jgi:hypothetical protein
VRILLAALALPCLGMTCGPAPSPPEPDDCSAPGDEPVAALAIGPQILDGEEFEPWRESDTATITEGAQGGEMLGVTLALGGDPLPACVRQRTELRQDGMVGAVADVPVHTYEAGEGARITSTLWLVFEPGFYPPPGSELAVVAEAGGATASARLTLAP